MPVDVQPKLEPNFSYHAKLIHDPNIVCSSPTPGVKLLAHSSGAVYLLQIHYPSAVGASDNASTSNANHTSQSVPDIHYSVNCLHHNKTLNMKVRLTEEEKSRIPIRMDAAVYSTGLYNNILGQLSSSQKVVKLLKAVMDSDVGT
jgi:ribosomal protein S26